MSNKVVFVFRNDIFIVFITLFYLTFICSDYSSLNENNIVDPDMCTVNSLKMDIK